MLGQRGCGKSYLARQVQACYARRFVFDTLCEYDDEKGSVVVHNYAEFSRVVVDLARTDAKKFTVVFQFDIERADNEGEFNEALRLIHYYGRLTGRSSLTIIEEVQNFASTHAVCHWLRNALLTGRHAHMALLFTTQRPGECHKTIVSQAHHIFCGRLFEPNDVQYCRTAIGDDALRLHALADRVFLYRDSRGNIKFVHT